MENIGESAHIDPRDLPEGFKAQDPNDSSGRSSNNNAAAAQKEQIDEQRQAVLQQVLTPEALARLNRIKLVKDKKAKIVESNIISMAMSGRLPGKINEGKLIEMLERGCAKDAQSSGSISIQRKKYAFDSDEDEDDDDL
ncbi:hypothetical protein ACA910_005918 [Epithemia clementina (nom. ined.)]